MPTSSKGKENDELLYTCLVTRYGPRISCQREGLTSFLRSLKICWRAIFFLLLLDCEIDLTCSLRHKRIVKYSFILFLYFLTQHVWCRCLTFVDRKEKKYYGSVLQKRIAQCLSRHVSTSDQNFDLVRSKFVKLNLIPRITHLNWSCCDTLRLFSLKIVVLLYLKWQLSIRNMCCFIAKLSL